MGVVWNSGQGGHICDHCRKLLWSGFSDSPLFIYGVAISDLIRDGDDVFCNEKCREDSKQQGQKEEV